jgi:toxin HigB-1
LNVYIDNKDLEKLYTTGFSKKLKLPDQVIDKFFATIQKIESAINIYDLWQDKGLNFEKLKGYKNKYSMRLSGKYRLEMEIKWQNIDETIGDFILITISNHYGD